MQSEIMQKLLSAQNITSIIAGANEHSGAGYIFVALHSA